MTRQVASGRMPRQVNDSRSWAGLVAANSTTKPAVSRVAAWRVTAAPGHRVARRAPFPGLPGLLALLLLRRELLHLGARGGDAAAVLGRPDLRDGGPAREIARELELAGRALGLALE